MKLRCRLGWHDWSKWYDVRLELTSGLKLVTVSGKRRVCHLCKRKEIREA